MSRALRRHDRTRLSSATAPFACYTAPRMNPRQIETHAMARAPRTTPKAAPHRRSRDDSGTLTVAQAFRATTGAGWASGSGSVREPTAFTHAHGLAAPQAQADRLDENADLPLTNPRWPPVKDRPQAATRLQLFA